MNKVFILIRDKLGDSLIAAQAVLTLRDQYPELDITLMMRYDYSVFLQQEKNIRLLPYRSHFHAWCRIFLLSWRKPYEALIVLRGFGKKTAQLGKLVPARRKIHMQGSFPTIFTEYPLQSIRDSEPLIESAWQTLRLLFSDIKAVQQLCFPSLRHIRSQIASTFIGICPITDETRKNLTPLAISHIIAYIREQHPNWPISILVRHRTEGEAYRSFLQSGVNIVAFENTRQLFSLFTQMNHYYGADTGLYHLAAAMDIPATVFFGPTQPHKIVLPQQKTTAIRIAGLGNQHCDEKSCQRAICLELATHNVLAVPNDVSLDQTPVTCPMRTLSIEQLTHNQTLRQNTGKAGA